MKEFPHTMASGLTIDSGDYEATLDRLLEHLDLDAIRDDQAARRARGDVKQIGVGFSTYNEMCGLAPSRILGAIRYAVGGWDASTVRFQPLGSVQVVTGTSPHGQSHETTFAQIVADQLGVGIDDVEVIHGDTASSQLGMDTYGSRSLTVGGIALWHAGEKVIAKARQIVAHQLEVSEEDLEFENGTFSVKGSPDRSMTIQAAAFEAHTAHNLPDGMEPGLEATAVYDPPNFSWPAGAHAAVVEVDTETGDTRLIRYIAVDDVGNPVNPQIIDGQVHGGVTQGIAAALYEEGRVRRGGQPPHDDDGDVSRAVRRRAAVVRDGSHRDGGRQPTRRERRGGDGHDRGRAGSDQRRRRRPLAPGCHGRAASGHARASLEGDRGGEDVIPAGFDYEVAESVDHAIELLGQKRGREAPGGRPLAPPGDEAPARPAGAPRRRRTSRRPLLRHARKETRSRSARSRGTRTSRPRRCCASTARSSRTQPARSATRRSTTAGRSAARSRTAIPPPISRA